MAAVNSSVHCKTLTNEGGTREKFHVQLATDLLSAAAINDDTSLPVCVQPSAL